MNKLIIDEISIIINQFTIGQPMWCVSWDNPELIEYKLAKIDITILDNNYADITFTLDHPTNPAMSSAYNYKDFNDYFFRSKSLAEDKLRRQWNL